MHWNSCSSNTFQHTEDDKVPWRRKRKEEEEEEEEEGEAMLVSPPPQ